MPTYPLDFLPVFGTIAPCFSEPKGDSKMAKNTATGALLRTSAQRTAALFSDRSFISARLMIASRLPGVRRLMLFKVPKLRVGKWPFSPLIARRRNLRAKWSRSASMSCSFIDRGNGVHVGWLAIYGPFWVSMIFGLLDCRTITARLVG